jgi:hypothetical protein
MPLVIVEQGNLNASDVSGRPGGIFSNAVNSMHDERGSTARKHQGDPATDQLAFPSSRRFLSRVAISFSSLHCLRWCFVEGHHRFSRLEVNEWMIVMF